MVQTYERERWRRCDSHWKMDFTFQIVMRQWQTNADASAATTTIAAEIATVTALKPIKFT